MEWIALSLLFSYNDFHKQTYGEFLLSIAGFIQEKNDAIKSYISLEQENQKLMKENAILKQQLAETQQKLNAAKHRIPYSRSFNLLPDSLFPVSIFSFIPARLIGNNLYDDYNYFIIDKGKKHGIELDMGVVSSEGVVGVIIETSENFSTGISLLNQYFRLSAKLKSSNVHGTIHWRGKNPRLVYLEYVPLHIPVQVGDTVITSAYSNYFTEGYHVGKVIDVRDPKDGQGFHEILVKLSTDFYTLENVYLVKNHFHEELKKFRKQYFGS